jgi:N-acetylmuramoyl-L-alanine amidase
MLSLLTTHSLLAASLAGILDLRASSAGNKTRVVFDLSLPVKYHYSLYPQKIVIDIQDAILAKPFNTASLQGSPIADVTSNAENKNDWHIVLELKNPMTAKTFLLPPAEGKHNYRLVVDLYKSAISAENNSSDEIKPMVTYFSASSTKHPLGTSVDVAPKNNPFTFKSTNSPTASLQPAAVAKPPSPSLAQVNGQYPFVRSVTKSHPLAQNETQQDWQANPIVPPAPSQKGRHTIIVVIDPGHGGKDPGASGKGGNKEKNVVLAISRHLRDLINREPGYRAILTRDGDYFIPLRQRLNIARSYKADLFIAVHADAINNPFANGASVFALSERGATSEAAKWLAERENQSEMIGVGDLSDKDQLLRSVLIDLSQTHTISVSLQMGNSVLQQLSRVTHLHNARVEQAAFVVLKSPDIPSLLIETGYITNPSQEQQLIQPYYQSQIASAILQGVKGYFSRHPTQDNLLS